MIQLIFKMSMQLVMLLKEGFSLLQQLSWQVDSLQVDFSTKEKNSWAINLSLQLSLHHLNMAVLVIHKKMQLRSLGKKTLLLMQVNLNLCNGTLTMIVKETVMLNLCAIKLKMKKLLVFIILALMQERWHKDSQ